MQVRAPLTAAALAIFVSACGVTDPSQNTVTPIAGTLSPGGAVTHSFRASKNGELSVTMTSVTPPPATGGSIAVALGQTVSGQCALLPGYVGAVIVNRSIQFFQINRGDYCLLVYDPGVLLSATAYAGNISHP